ncbi:tape measure protein [Stenotrophomonas phage Siara]|uniref:Tape measure protein n=1 Tax=Stenotrophomonas phage Siara TaxID=2859658 RepID=A0AAE8BHY6_9CAUD|nr:tape measure protein [Stenotrophomonas phage Siara]QYW02049.1 tape measure protein [Stenotrophomonas phage Siara]
MADIIDIQVRDSGTTTATKNLEQLGDAAITAGKNIKGLKDALQLLSRGDFQKAKNGLAQASANLAKASRDATNATSTLTAAQTRSLVNEQKIALSRQKVATETQRTLLVQAKLATETQRAATLAAQQALAEDRLASAQDRRAAAAERAARASTATANAAKATTDSSNAAARATANFTNEQKKLSGAAEANRMHMVNVSYQLQDIVVGLASGQRPMTVFIQQGAQLYGIAQMMNISLAGLAKQIAIMSASFLANPIVLMVAALASAALATERYMSMQKDFNKALISTNNYIGQTADNFDRLAESIAQKSGSSFAEAARGMTAVAASGKISAKQFEEISVIAVKMQRTVGTAVEDTVASYAELAKDPVATLEKLNQTQRFLTVEQYKRVKALEDEGRAQEAASEAIKLFMANQSQMAANIEAARGPALRLWDDLTTKISNATTELGRYIATAADASVVNYQQIGQGFGQLFSGNIRAGLRNIDQGVAREVYGPSDAEKRQNAELADLTRRYNENRAAVEAAQKAEHARQIGMEKGKQALREHEAGLSKVIARELELVKVRKLVRDAGMDPNGNGKGEVNRLMGLYDEKNKGPKGPKGPSDGSDEMLARLRKQNVLNEARVESERKLTETQRLLAEAQDYLEQKGSKLSASKRKLIEESMAQAKASGEAKEAAERELAVRERQIRLENALAKDEANIRQQNALSLMSLTVDSETMDRARRRLDIDKWYAAELDKLRQDNVAKDEDERQAAEEKLRESYQRRLDMERQYQSGLATMRDDWKVGMQGAAADYMKNLTDGANQTRNLFTNAFKGAEDAFVRFVTTGKFSFKDFANSIIADLARIAAQKAIAGIIGALIPGMGGVSTAVSGSANLGGSNLGYTQSANGNAFAGGSGLSASSNRVVNGYRTFQFANGAAFANNGSLAERGAEAVMPLQRDTSGQLGVKAIGGNGTPNVTVNVYGGNGDQTADAQASTDANGNFNIDVFLKGAAGEVANQIANRNGPVSKALQNTYGLRPQVG